MTERTPVIRAMWLLTRLRLLRLVNQTSSMYNRPIGGRKGRKGTPGKRRNRWLVTALVAFFMVFSFGNLIGQAIVNLHLALDRMPPAHALATGVAHQPGSGLVAGAFSEALARGLTMELTLLLCVAILVSLGAREMAQPDWDLEWLATLPASLRALLWSRIVERSVANPTGILALWPTCSLLAWFSGLRWSAPIAGLGAAMPLLMLAAAARTLVDTGLRLSLAPSRLRNLQAVVSVGSVLLLYLTMSAGMGWHSGMIFDMARDFPAWPAWTPPGLAVRVLNARDRWDALALGLMLCAESAVLVYAAVRLLEYQLRDGIVAAGSRESTRSAGLARARSATRRRLRLGGVIQRRELTLLSRDRNFLVQTLVLPVVMVGSQLLLNGGFHNAASSGVSSTTMAAIGFAIAAYALMMSAFQTLNSEGGALWMLYTVPRSIDDVLSEKLRLWSVLVLIYPAAVFTIGIWMTQRLDLELMGLGAIVLLGVPIYAVIATSLGVFACDPLTQEARARLSPTYVYLYMLLSALYTYAIYASEWWQRLVLIVLSALLALALWQKARDELPFLLDPASSPPSRVSTADGMIAAMMFFVFQGLGALMIGHAGQPLTGSSLIIVFSSAGALTYGLVRLTYWRSRTQGVPSLLPGGRGAGRALGWGLLTGVACAAAGVAYLYALTRLVPDSEALRRSATGLSRGAWIPLLAVVAAPLFEEFIFRGLIFSGLRRSMGPAVAILASAAVFAIVHPPLSMIPVFGLGVGAALAYDRTGALLAPMVTHAVYNAAVISFQVLD